MSMSVSASSSSALSYLQSLLQQGSTQDTKKTSSSDPLSMLMQAMSADTSTTAQTGTAASSTATTGTGSSCPQFSSDTMSALLSAQGQQSAGGPDAKLFAKLDTNGDGQISKDEFTAAASKAGADSSVADAVFNKIDANGDGSITQDELTKADKASRPHHHHHVEGGGGAQGAGGAQDPLEAMLSSGTASGATTQTSTNADGSTTTTISYADGSKIDLTSAASAASGSASTASKSNLLEQLIKLQAQALNAATSTMSAVA